MGSRPPPPRPCALFAVLAAAFLATASAARVAAAAEGSPVLAATTPAAAAPAPAQQHPRRAAGGLRRFLAHRRLAALVALAGSPRIGAATRALVCPQLFHQQLDLNRDGFVDRNEFKAWISIAGAQEPERMALFEASDVDGDERLNMREADYMRYLHESLHDENGFYSLVNGSVSESVHALLEEWDDNGDGHINLHEHQESMRESAEMWGLKERVNTKFGEQWMQKIFDYADINRDGFLNIREFHFSEFLIRAEVDWQRKHQDALLTMMFRMMDTNRNGRIDQGEASAAVMREQDAKRNHLESGGCKCKVPKVSVVEEIAKYFEAADMDKDGSLDWNESTRLAAHVVSNLYPDGQHR